MQESDRFDATPATARMTEREFQQQKSSSINVNKYEHKCKHKCGALITFVLMLTIARLLSLKRYSEYVWFSLIQKITSLHCQQRVLG